MLQALGVSFVVSHFFCEELESLFIELQDEDEVKRIQPDFDQLKQSSDQIKEVVIMSKAINKEYDFTLRSCCPWIGIDEDPVTGSIHSILGHFWAKRLNKKTLTVHQASERNGHIIVKPLDTSVLIGGKCQSIVEGRLSISTNHY